MNWIATQKRCDSCGNSRIIVSENGFHSVCCLSQKKCMDCFMGKKDHYLGRNTNIKDRIAGEWEFTEKISYDTLDAPQTISWETPLPTIIKVDESEDTK